MTINYISLFNDKQKRHTLLILAFFHIFIITISNYLVQIPFKIAFPYNFFNLNDNFSFISTWGTLTFPFIFLATDLTVRVFGAKDARHIIFVVMIPALFISYLISTLFAETQYQGFQSLAMFNLFSFRIALASFLAYVFGQLLDILVFNRLRALNTWWIAPSSSMIFGTLCDTYIFFSVAFYKSSDPFMAEHWLDIGLVDYLFKLFIGLLLFVPAYGSLLSILIKKLKVNT